MAQLAHAEVINFARAKTADRGRPNQWTLEGPYEICAFLGAEIHASKRKFAEIARSAGLCVQTVSNIASGETKNPSIRTVLAIFQTLGFSVKAEDGR